MAAVTEGQAKQAKVVCKDNGYFEVVERPGCGHEARVSTESIQWGITAGKRRDNRVRHLTRTSCGKCAHEGGRA